MAVNKVVWGNTTLIDLTGLTVTADTLGKGATALDKSGKQITGTMESGGGASTVETVTVTPSSASTTFTISGLKGQPIAWTLNYTANLTAASTRYVVAASSNGSTRTVQYAYKSGSNSYIYSSTSYLTESYSNGTLTLKTSSTSNGGNFYRGAYRLTYIY